MQKHKKKLYKKFLLTSSQEHWASYKHHDRLYTLSFRRSRAAYEQNIVGTAISNPEVIFRYVREGTKKRDPIPGLRRPDGSIETNDEEKAQLFANHFQTAYIRERSLPDVGPPSHTENAKIEYVQILCNDVKKILKSLKKDKSPGPDGIPPILLKELAEEISYPLSNIFRLHWILDDYQKIGWQLTYRQFTKGASV